MQVHILLEKNFDYRIIENTYFVKIRFFSYLPDRYNLKLFIK